MAFRHRKTYQGGEAAAEKVVIPELSFPAVVSLFDSLERFTRVTGFDVRLHNDSGWYAGMPFASDVEKKRTLGYVDKGKRTVHVFRGNVHKPGFTVNDGEVLSRLLNEVFRNVDFNTVFAGEGAGSLRAYLMGSLDSADFSVFGRLFLDPPDYSGVKRLSNENPVAEGRFAKALLSYLGMPQTQMLQERLVGALRSCFNRMEYNGLKDGNSDAVASSVLNLVLNDASPDLSASVGSMKGDCFRLLGYPDEQLLLKGGELKKIRCDLKIDPVLFAKRFSEQIASPLGAFEDSRTGKMLYILDLAGKDFTIVSLENANRSVRRILRNDAGIGRTAVFGKCFSLTPDTVMRHIVRGELRFLQEGKNRFGMLKYPLLDVLDKKIEAESLAGIRSASSSQPLRSSVANIVNSFHNQKNFEKNYDPVKAYVDRREKYMQELEETLKLKGTPEHKDEIPVKAFRQGDRIPRSLISKVSFLKFEKAGIQTFGELLRTGGYQVLRMTDKATVTKLENYLREYGLTLFPRPKGMKPEQFLGLSFEKQKQAVLKDFSVCIAQMPDNILSFELPAPVGIDGKSVLGSAGFHLAAKMASKWEEWGNTPVFVSDQYLMVNGFKPLVKADPVNVHDEAGNPVSFYNVSDTDMPLNDAILFSLLSEKADVNREVVPRYFNVILNSLKEPQVSSDPTVSKSALWSVYKDSYECFGMNYSVRMGREFGAAEENPVPYVFVTSENVNGLVLSGELNGKVVSLKNGQVVLSVAGQNQVIGEDGLYVVGSGKDVTLLFPKVFDSLFEKKAGKGNLAVLRPGVRKQPVYSGVLKNKR